MKYSKPLIVVLACSCIYLFFCIPFIHEPLLGDSYVLPMFAEYFHDGKYYSAEHPPAYISLISLIINIFGKNYQWYRLIGIAGFIISLVMIYLVTGKVANNSKASYFACFLYAINPMAIKGSLITDIDTTILTPLLLLFIYFLLKYYDFFTPVKLAFMGILFSLSLWAKLTTPFLLIAAMFSSYACIKNTKKGFYFSSVILLIGLILFLLMWTVFSNYFNIPFYHPFEYLKGSFFSTNLVKIGESGGGIITMLVRISARLAIMSSVPLIAMYIYLTVKDTNDIITGRSGFAFSFLCIFSILLLVGYASVGQISHSFPKYHYPFVSVMCILLSILYFKYADYGGVSKWAYFAIVLFVIAYNILLIGDLLYLTDFYIRQQTIEAGRAMSDILKFVGIKTVMYLMVIPAVFIFIKRIKRGLSFFQSTIITLLICGISINLSTNIMQLKAKYFTVYCYGGEIPGDFYDLFKGKALTAENVLSTGDIRYMLGIRKRTEHVIWNNRNVFVDTVNKIKPDYIIFGISSNTVDQYKNIFHNREINSFLDQYYTGSKYGSYTVLSKKSVFDVITGQELSYIHGIKSSHGIH